MTDKYWIANNPNSEVTDAEAQKVEELSATSVAVADLNRLTTQHKVVTGVTALAAAGALAAGVRYHVTDLDGAAYTLPAASASTAGDKIEVIYIGILANGEVHKYGTANDFFAASSFVMKPSNATGNAAYAIDVADG